MRELEQTAQLVAESTRAVVLSGAGLSKSAGIPTFRDPDGLWTQPEYRQWGYRQTFDADPRRWYDNYWNLYDKRQEIGPSVAHYALKDLVESSIVDCLVTQNIDGLDLEAGVSSDKVYEIHGNCRVLDCTACEESVLTEDWLANHEARVDLPVCDDGQILKPSILLFGQDSVPGLAMVRSKAYERLSQADCLLVVGTSLIIPAIEEMVFEFTHPDKRLIVVNPKATVADRIADLYIHQAAEIALPALAKLLTT